MTPDTLLLALHDAGISLEPDGTALRWHGPKGALTLSLAAAIKEHKKLLLAVYATLADRDRDADWECVRDWVLDNSAKTFTPSVIAATRRTLPIGEDEWPESYSRRFRHALRVRGILLAFGDSPRILERTGT